MKEIIIAAAIMVLPSAAGAQPKEQAVVPQRQDGRFVIVHSPFARADTMMIDTATGRTWALTKFTDLNGEPVVWLLMDRIDSDADRRRVVQTHGLKPDNAKP